MGACLAGLLVVACDRDATAPDLVGPVEIVVRLDDVERWEASGPLVDAGEFCPSGRRQVLSVFNPDTGVEVSLQKFFLTPDELTSPAERPDALILHEHVCDDGSGAFVAAENLHRRDWEIRAGTGRYSGVSGAGSASFVVDFQANPSEVYIVAELGGDKRLSR